MINYFKAVHKKSWYVSEESYLDAVYRKNRERIDKAYFKEAKEQKLDVKAYGSLRRKFKERVKYFKESRKVSLSKAVKLYSNFTIFKSRREVGIENFLSGLKKNPEAWNYFRHLNRDEKGRYLSFDPDKLTWINSKLAIYDNKIEVSFLDSPVGVSVFDLRNNASQQFNYME